MATVTIAAKRRRTFVLAGISISEADDALSGIDADVKERFGAVEVHDVALSTLRAKLRDAGHQTKMAE
jgi:hypothetical protein